MRSRIISLAFVVIWLALAGCGAGDTTGPLGAGIDAPLFSADTGTPVGPVDGGATDDAADAAEDASDGDEDVEAGGGVVILPPGPDGGTADGDTAGGGNGGQDGDDGGPAPDCLTDGDCIAAHPCTDGVCFEGSCIQVMNTAPCNDGDDCTLDDACSQGVCVGVPMGACDDGDPCTVDDGCVDGGCAGVPMACDDGIACSTDVCYLGECKHLVMDLPECQLGIEIFTPDRAATLVSTEPVTVTGKLAAPAGGLLSLTIGGEEVGVAPDGTFSQSIEARTGINILTVEATDSFEQEARVVQAFAYAPEVVEPGSFAEPEPIPAGLLAWMDRAVFDDDDTGDLDDLASLVQLVVAGFDLNAALPDPLIPDEERPSFGWCTWDVAVTDVSIDLDEVDLYPVVDGLALKIHFSDLYAWVAATDDTFGCPDAVGSATSEAITVSAELAVAIGPDGVQVDLVDITVDIAEIELDIQEGVGQLFDWVINWFEDDLTALLKSELEGQVSGIVAPLLAGVITQFANFTYDFELPAIPPNTETLPMRLTVSPSNALLTPNGLELELTGGFGVEKAIAHESPGSLSGGCVGVPFGPGASCVGACGGQSPAGCWCDPFCANNEDCCQDYESLCVNPPAEALGVCCEATPTSTGCGGDLGCEACVCAFDSWCCDTEWDSICVNEAVTQCDAECQCGETCCEVGEATGCAGAACEDCVCDLDDFCCNTAWDGLCVAGAEADCAKACGCFSGPSTLPGSPLPHADPVELMALESVLNRFFFAVWWGGHTDVDLGGEQLAATVGDLGLPGLSLNVDLHLPPVITGCTTSGDQELQLGDVLMTAGFDLDGQSQSVTFFASARIAVELQLVEAEDGLHTVAIEVGEVIEAVAQLMGTTGDSPLLDNLDHEFIEAVLSQLFVGELLTGVTTTLPVRVIDLGEWVPGLPLGSNVAFDPSQLEVLGAAITVGGGLVSVP